MHLCLSGSGNRPASRAATELRRDASYTPCRDRPWMVAARSLPRILQPLASQPSLQRATAARARPRLAAPAHAPPRVLLANSRLAPSPLAHHLPQTARALLRARRRVPPGAPPRPASLKLSRPHTD
ncbi:hypothetical protein ZWY2020_007216 [Hordeum vulgare]|nr:hypothetical protein ZWY2020_007216 [Hordeum vulgare]